MPLSSKITKRLFFMAQFLQCGVGIHVDLSQEYKKSKREFGALPWILKKMFPESRIQKNTKEIKCKNMIIDIQAYARMNLL